MLKKVSIAILAMIMFLTGFETTKAWTLLPNYYNYDTGAVLSDNQGDVLLSAVHKTTVRYYSELVYQKIFVQVGPDPVHHYVEATNCSRVDYIRKSFFPPTGVINGTCNDYVYIDLPVPQNAHVWFVTSDEPITSDRSTWKNVVQSEAHVQ